MQGVREGNVPIIQSVVHRRIRINFLAKRGAPVSKGIELFSIVVGKEATKEVFCVERCFCLYLFNLLIHHHTLKLLHFIPMQLLVSSDGVKELKRTQ